MSKPNTVTNLLTPAELAAWEVAEQRGLAINTNDLRAMLAAARQATLPTGPDSLHCPKCSGADFELFIAGPRSGEVACSGCGYLFTPPAPARATGRARPFWRS